jgi:ATP-dependent DNA helicase RecQ
MAEPCGICDVCLAKRRRAKQSESVEHSIMAVVAGGDVTIKDVVTAVAASSEEIIERIDKMVRDGKFYISEGGKLKINK